MHYLLKISLRNLLRQKRRNIFLGIGIAFGMMILIIANSFSHGITDTLLNKIILQIAGHAQISFEESYQGTFKTQRLNMIRDKDQLIRLFEEEVDEIKSVRESMFSFGRAIGNGKADYLAIVGINTANQSVVNDYIATYKFKEGSFEDFQNEDRGIPIIIAEDKAEYLNVKLNDTIKMRFETIYGQQQSVNWLIKGIVRSENLFFDMAGYVRMKDLKELLDYQPNETQAFFLIIEKPKKAIKTADIIHKALSNQIKPMATVTVVDQHEVLMAGLQTNDQDQIAEFNKNIQWTEGSIDNLLKENQTAISIQMQKLTGLKSGDSFEAVFENRLNGEKSSYSFTVGAVFSSPDINRPVAYTLRQPFYFKYQKAFPKTLTEKDYQEYLNGEDSVFSQVISPEWKLMPRARSTDESVENYRKLRNSKWEGVSIDISTMYESASDVLKIENVLKVITLIAVLILFFIILIGVANTLRMNIRERTREIGTTRAIGMQRSDVRNTFILETAFLTLFSSIIGVILGFIVMGILGSIPFYTSSPLAILLVDRRINFVPLWTDIVFNVILIVSIASITAYFPAKKAAELSAADALRHFE